MRAALYILGQLTDDDVEWLIVHGRRRAAPGGTLLIREGQPVASVFVLLDGRVAIQRGGARVAAAGPGELLGEMSFVDSRPPSATVMADGDAVLLEIARGALAAHLAADHGFASRFYRAVAMALVDRLRGAMGGGDASDADELDGDVLDAVSAAGERFQRILARLARA